MLDNPSSPLRTGKVTWSAQSLEVSEEDDRGTELGSSDGSGLASIIVISIAGGFLVIGTIARMRNRRNCPKEVFTAILGLVDFTTDVIFLASIASRRSEGIAVHFNVCLAFMVIP